MKKFKSLLLICLAALLVFAIPVAACKTDEEEPVEPQEVLESISLDTSNVKTKFSIGDDYSAEGLVITATFSKEGETRSQNLGLTDEGVAIDSSAYDKSAGGEYMILVSYTNSGVTKSDRYEVSVVPLRKGLSVTYKTGVENSVNLSETMTTADMTNAASWIEVRQPNKVGEVDYTADPLPASAYSVKIYKDKEEVTELSGLSRGAYQIWASKEEDGATLEGFALYYVVDEVDKIELKSGNLSQQRSLKETMSSTWVFTVTYKSGDTAEVNSSNRYITIPKINANATADNGSVKVTFNEPLPNGASQSKFVNVAYTLTGVKAVPDMAILNTAEMDGVNKQYVTEFTTFEVRDGSINTSKSATVSLPTGIEVNGSTSISVGQSYRSGGATTAEKPRKILFSTDRNFEIYVYGISTGTGDRRILIEATGANGDYIDYNAVDDYKTMLDNGVEDQGGGATVRAQAITNVTALTDFEITFTGNIDLFYVLIVFEAV